MFAPHKIEWTPEKSSRIWDYYGSNPSYRENYFGFQKGGAVSAKIASSVPWKSIKRILDFGCGRGDVMAACMKRMLPSQTIAGVDFSERNVESVRDRFAGNSMFAGVSFPSDLQGFDLVICTEVVEHLTDDELADCLARLAKALNPGGHLIITTPNNEDYSASEVICPECGCIFHRWQHLRTWTAHSLATRLSERFITVAVEAVSWAHPLRRAVSFIKPTLKNSLFYVGRKHQESSSVSV